MQIWHHLREERRAGSTLDKTHNKYYFFNIQHQMFLVNQGCLAVRLLTIATTNLYSKLNLDLDGSVVI